VNSEQNSKPQFTVIMVRTTNRKTHTELDYVNFAFRPGSLFECDVGTSINRYVSTSLYWYGNW